MEIIWREKVEERKRERHLKDKDKRELKNCRKEMGEFERRWGKDKERVYYSSFARMAVTHSCKTTTINCILPFDESVRKWEWGKVKDYQRKKSTLAESAEFLFTTGWRWMTITVHLLWGHPGQLSPCSHSHLFAHKEAQLDFTFAGILRCSLSPLISFLSGLKKLPVLHVDQLWPVWGFDWGY